MSYELMSRSSHAGKRAVAILHGVGDPSSSLSPPSFETARPRRGYVQPAKPARMKRYCPFCDASEHYLSQCASFAQLTPDQVKTWIRRHNRCWRFARSHHAAQCDLKKPCSLCRGLHLRSLHDVNISPSSTEESATVEKSCFTSFSSDNNNNNNLLHLYSAFLDTQSALHSKGDISSSTTNVQHPPG